MLPVEIQHGERNVAAEEDVPHGRVLVWGIVSPNEIRVSERIHRRYWGHGVTLIVGNVLGTREGSTAIAVTADLEVKKLARVLIPGAIELAAAVNTDFWVFY